ncbi:hypothetical protein ACQRUO_18450, partial [Kitasatospora sp. LaBMicrA B282]
MTHTDRGDRAGPAIAPGTRRRTDRTWWRWAPAVLLAGAIGQLWSITVVRLDRAGFTVADPAAYWAVAAPGLTGTVAGLLAALVPAARPGRRVALVLALSAGPLLWLGFALRDPTTPFPVLLLIAALGGPAGAVLPAVLGGRAVAAGSLHRLAAVGCLGVALVQGATPLVVAAGVLGPVAGGPR